MAVQALLGALGLAAAGEAVGVEEAIIPPGQEELLSEMLGRGATLPGECTFRGGQADPRAIRASYTCAGGEVIVELRHPDAAPADAVRTARFAIMERGGSPPPALIEALAQRIRSRETAFEWTRLHRRSALDTALLITVIAIPAAAGLLGGAVVGRFLYRRRRATSGATRHGAGSRARIGLAIRAGGLIVVALIAVYGSVLRADDNVATLFGVVALPAVLWLTIAGGFGSGSVRRSDWVGLVPFAVALVVRMFFTLHSVQEIEIQFAQGPIGRHSVVYPLWQLFFMPLVGDPHASTMQLNGVLGALASPALYLFIRQRLESRTAAFLCALFLAVHPLIARFSPTDGPYSLLLATWFSGLALLSSRPLDSLSLLGGAVLLGIGATTRIEGVLFLVASLLLLDLRALLAAVRRDPLMAGLASLIVAALVAVQMFFLFGAYLSGLLGIETLGPVLRPPARLVFRDAVWPAAYNDPLFTALVWSGALAGLAGRFRLGLLAYLAMLIVLVPVAQSGDFAHSLHRLIPVCALQTIVAGIGAYALTAWIPAVTRSGWLAAVPGTIAAVYILVGHRGDLTRPYLFTEEYELVRSHLAPGGVAATECALMTFNANFVGDIDLHDFGQVVPGVRILDCRRVDCPGALSNGGCVYYVRSAACYYHPDGIPPVCAGAGARDVRVCMHDVCASFERAVALEAVDVRMIDLLDVVPTARHYPDRAEVGLFRVRAKGAAMSGA
jgi:hypothetical protein